MEPTHIASLHLRFHGDLSSLIRKKKLRRQSISITLTRKASIKDIIESLGIPHTEVGALRKAGSEVDFSCLPCAGDRIEVLPISAGFLPVQSTRLRPAPLPSYRFLVDINVSRLASLLRMAGFDTEAVSERGELGSKQAIAEASLSEKRILLSRDRDVLKLSCLVHGRLIRNQTPYHQLREVVTLFRIQPLARPFSRCMRCNRPLTPVSKADVLHRLEPLTKKYYRIFSQCTHCGNIYWQGSHYQHMQDILTESDVQTR